jgi:hypothetical protein
MRKRRLFHVKQSPFVYAGEMGGKTNNLQIIVLMKLAVMGTASPSTPSTVNWECHSLVAADNFAAPTVLY